MKIIFLAINISLWIFMFYYTFIAPQALTGIQINRCLFILAGNYIVSYFLKEKE